MGGQSNSTSTFPSGIWNNPDVGRKSSTFPSGIWNNPDVGRKSSTFPSGIWNNPDVGRKSSTFPSGVWNNPGPLTGGGFPTMGLNSGNTIGGGMKSTPSQPPAPAAQTLPYVNQPAPKTRSKVVAPSVGAMNVRR